MALDQCSETDMIMNSKWTCVTGYLLREIKKEDIPLPEGEVNPAAPLPKHVMVIMVRSVQHYSFV